MHGGIVREETIFAVDHIDPAFAANRDDGGSLDYEITHYYDFGQSVSVLKFFQKITFANDLGSEEISEMQAIVVSHPATLIWAGKSKRILCDSWHDGPRRRRFCQV